MFHYIYIWNENSLYSLQVCGFNLDNMECTRQITTFLWKSYNDTSQKLCFHCQ